MRCFIPLLLVVFSGHLPMVADGQDYYDDPVPDVEYPVWNDEKYEMANSARDEEYLTSEEKKVYLYLNLVRMNPELFASTYLDYLKNSTNYYEASLYRELLQMKPLPVLKPNRLLFESARCHSTDSGERGYTGHERGKCLTECHRGKRS